MSGIQKVWGYSSCLLLVGEGNCPGRARSLEAEEYGSWGCGLNTGLLEPNLTLLGPNLTILSLKLSRACASLGPTCGPKMAQLRHVWAQVVVKMTEVEPVWGQLQLYEPSMKHWSKKSREIAVARVFSMPRSVGTIRQVALCWTQLGPKLEPSEHVGPKLGHMHVPQM